MLTVTATCKSQETEETNSGVGEPVARHGNSSFSPVLSEKYITPAGGPSTIDGGALTAQHTIEIGNTAIQAAFL